MAGMGVVFATQRALLLLLVLVAVVICDAIPVPTGEVPVDWKVAVDNGSLLYTVNEPSRQALQGQVGNGFIATSINSSVIYLGGTFNPLSETGAGNLSRRSRIPTTVRIFVQNSTAFASAQDLRRGLFLRRSIINNGCQNSQPVVVEQRWYAHRVNRSLLVHEIEIDTTRCEIGSPVQIHVIDDDGGPSVDIKFSSQRLYSSRKANGVDTYCEVFFGETIYPEEPNTSRVAIAYARWRLFNDVINIKSSASNTISRLLSTFRSSLEFSSQDRVNLTQLAVQDWMRYLSYQEILLPTHVKEWDGLWSRGIEIKGDKRLGSVISASYYAILSSIRSDWGFSVSPGGLSFGGGNATGYPLQEFQGYFGHTFWDADVFVMPSLLPLYPDLAFSILDYRYNRIDISEQVAQSYGYNGTKYAWESALTGFEENQKPNIEDHLSADIGAISIRQFFRATNDLQWMKEKGYPMLRGIADFWISRVIPSTSLPGQFSINNIQPPNEFALNINNSVFTNAVASSALLYFCKISDMLGITVPDYYREVGNNITIPFNSTAQMHIEYDGRLPSDKQEIKQADVSLLAYPLQYPMSHTVQLNDLLHESSLVSPLGPAMTHGMFAVNWLSLGPQYHDQASESFEKGYSLYVEGPFLSWLECPDPGCKVGENGNLTIVKACPNFITGAGGFLQSVIYGYCGIRYNDDDMTITPILPRNVTEVFMRQLFFLGNDLSLRYDENNIEVTLLSISSAGSKFSITINGSKQSMVLGRTYVTAYGDTIVVSPL